LPRIKYRSPKTNKRSHIVTLREEEVPKDDRVVVETLFPEEEEEVEEEK
jgi:hypothetical protein